MFELWTQYEASGRPNRCVETGTIEDCVRAIDRAGLEWGEYRIVEAGSLWRDAAGFLHFSGAGVVIAR